MGLAASQARLLTITARLADNELRSQTINNAKMRLATQSAQASDEYVSALNCSQMMFNNTTDAGLAQTQALTFNALTQFSQFNNQYGLINSSGQILVSEEDDKIFKAHSNDLEGFLKAHNLEWDTTFFNDEEDLEAKLESFYSSDKNKFIWELLEGRTENSTLKDLYLSAISKEASAEYLNYEDMAAKYYQAKVQAYDDAVQALRNKLFSEEDEATIAKNLSTKDINVRDNTNSNNRITSEIQDELFNYLFKAYNMDIETKQDDDGNTVTDIDKTISNFVNSANEQLRNNCKELVEYIKSLNVYKYTYKNESNNDVTENIPVWCHPANRVIPKSDENGNFTSLDGMEIKGNDLYIPKSCKFDCETEEIKEMEISEVYYLDDSGKPISVKLPTDGEFYVIPGITKSTLDTTVTNRVEFGIVKKKPAEEPTVEPEGENEEKEEKEENEYYTRTYFMGYYDNCYYKYEYLTDPTSEIKDVNEDNKIDNTDRDAYIKALKEQFVMDFFDMLFSPQYLDVSGSEDFKDFVKTYGFDIDNVTYLKDFDALVADGIYKPSATPAFQSVLDVYLTQKMVDVLGEPKFAWVDNSVPPTDNPDAKAQWLTNLFNRMQKGYKVLENGLASSKDWIEYAFNSGLVSMEQVDKSQNWIAMDYKSCANIFEETDNSTAVAMAEAKYNRAMNDIKQKDSMYDLELKNIDTEHSSLQTEYDVIKGVINKNIERTMKFNQSA